MLRESSQTLCEAKKSGLPSEDLCSGYSQISTVLLHHCSPFTHIMCFLDASFIYLQIWDLACQQIV